MGQGSSSRRSTASSFSRRMRSSPGPKRHSLGGGGSKRRRELSDTFNLLNENFQITLMNVNTATEEELMTLSGVTRTLAHDIVEYRQRIGQFKKVEDLALVSGVGANKLAAIKSEICVSSRGSHKGLSRSSSCGTPSEDSCDPLDVRLQAPNGLTAATLLAGSNNNHHLTATAPQPQQQPLDVNTATMFELMAVRNINQLLAANIVHHREKKGPFRSLDEMQKVKGLNYRLLGELKQYLSVDPERLSQAMANGHAGRRRHRRSSSVPPVVGNGPVAAPATVPAKGGGPAMGDGRLDVNRVVYEMLADRSQRPKTLDRFSFRRNRQAALRLATWNLERMTADKADNLGVVEVVCLTILENGISLIALQELGESQVLEKICKELNCPTIKKVQDWVGLKGLWKCQVSEPINPIGKGEERLGFLYDTRRGITPVGSETLDFPQPNNNGPAFPGAFYATFRAADSIQFSLLNVHLPPPQKAEIVTQSEALNGPVGAPLATVVGAWLEKVKDTALHIVLGDFNCDPATKDVHVLQDRFTHLVRSGETTNSREEDVEDHPCFDNIWMSASVGKFHTGKHDVIVEGLCHLAIPRGWSWGGCASAHCPVWAEFFVPTLSSLSALTDAIEQEAAAVLPNGDVDSALASSGNASPNGESSSRECDCSASNASEENSC